MATTVLVIFIIVYIGMILGEIPGLTLDRTGVALLGAIALLAVGAIKQQQAWSAIDVPTISLLFGLMVVSAQFRLGGFYTASTRRFAALALSPPQLLALLIAGVAALSAVLTNDVVCLAVAPALIEGCARRRLNPVPFLIALACAANIGSAATLIGNPQNVLIGQSLHMSFPGYLAIAIVPVTLSLAAAWAIICWRVRGRWEGATPIPDSIGEPAFDRWQTAKGTFVALGLVAVFLFLHWPRDIAALAAAGILLLSRRMKSREMLGLVDWELLVLFIGLFVVNDAMRSAGWLDAAWKSLRASGIDPSSPPILFGLAAVLSNFVSNVPATMLLLPAAHHEMAGAILALSSTFAGNFIIVGSIANIIVVTQAERFGVKIRWGDHARVGVPVTLASLAIAAAWLWFVSS